MKNFEQEALEFAARVLELCFRSHETALLTQYIDHMPWLESEMQSAADGQLRELLTERNMKTLKAVLLSGSFWLVYGVLCAPAQAVCGDRARVSMVLEHTADGMRLWQLHFSGIGDERRKVPHHRAAGDSGVRRVLRLRGRMDYMARGIPGCTYQCRNDAMYTLLQVTSGFAAMFGYTREEIRTCFQNRFLLMIAPEDRDRVCWEMSAQLQHGADSEIEYRVLCKDGQSIWVLDKGRLIACDAREERLCGILVEINERKREQEELRLSLERYQVIMDQATDIIFEWDIREDTLTFSPNFYKKFGYHAISKEISVQIPLSEDIHVDDRPAFIKIMRNSAAGVPYSETEFRVRDNSGRYVWCRIRATVQFDDAKRPIKAVGVILDIDAEKKQKQALLEQSRRDALTGIYNKAAINALVEQRMRQKGAEVCQALMIIDVDYFKAVNDTYGHLCGDSLLSDVAAALRSQIRSTDLVGRIGGDEFLVYLPEVTDEKAARAKANTIGKAVCKLRPAPNAPTITCSIGVALFPRGSIDYFALYKCADQALYFQKWNGRGGVTFYSPAISVGKMPCGNAKSAVSESIGADDSVIADENMSQYAFRVLYTAADTEAALCRVMEIIGRSYDVSRLYIFENSPDGRFCNNTFEWCGEGIASQTALLQNMSYEEDLPGYAQCFGEDGVFRCTDIASLPPRVRTLSETQPLYAVMQCAILDEGEFRGFIGFDECKNTSPWSQNRIATFRMTANVLASFLVKLRLKQAVQRGAVPPAQALQQD